MFLISKCFCQLLDALSLLHDAHVIHCDLKPENILLSRYSFHDLFIYLLFENDYLIPKILLVLCWFLMIVLGM